MNVCIYLTSPYLLCLAACVAWLQHATRLQELSYNVIQVNVDGRNHTDPYMVCIVFFFNVGCIVYVFGA